jgi:hypothetical protein
LSSVWNIANLPSKIGMKENDFRCGAGTERYTGGSLPDAKWWICVEESPRLKLMLQADIQKSLNITFQFVKELGETVAKRRDFACLGSKAVNASAPQYELIT